MSARTQFLRFVIIRLFELNPLVMEAHLARSIASRSSVLARVEDPVLHFLEGQDQAPVFTEGRRQICKNLGSSYSL